MNNVASIPLKVLIVEDETLVGMGLQNSLSRLGHQPVAQATTEDEAVSLFRDRSPDMLLVDIKLSVGDGISAVRRCMEARRVPVIIISAFSDRDLILGAADAGTYGYLVKPVEERELAAQIQIALQRFNDAERLRGENDTLMKNLETRKLVERAKGILMRRLNLAEADAHRRLQQESQKRRVSLCEIARKIIESEELLGA